MIDLTELNAQAEVVKADPHNPEKLKKYLQIMLDLNRQLPEDEPMFKPERIALVELTYAKLVGYLETGEFIGATAEEIASHVNTPRIGH